MEADVQNAFADVHKKVEAQGKEQTTKMEAGFDSLGRKMDSMNEVNHEQDLAIQHNAGQISINAVDIDRLGKKIKASADRVWSIARPILIEALKYVIFGGIMAAILRYLLKAG